MEIENPSREQLPIITEKKSCLTLEVLDNEPGFYQYVIKPMLYPGHEGELCTWLKEMGLMQRSLRCHNALKSPTCNVPMKWTQARIVDKYQWKCGECCRKRPIRDDSFFKNTKCSLTATLRIILGWCKDMAPEELVDILNVKVHVVKRLYQTCSQIAEGYVRTHKNDWKLGGPGVIVIIDLYPDGCAKVSGSNPEYQNNNPTQILCIAEAKTIPTNYWFHVMLSSDDEAAREEALRVVRNMVKPGSVLVADPNAKVCSYNDLLACKEYPTIVSIQDLMRHNKPDSTILQNLETIWDPAVRICEEAQYYSQQEVQSYLYNMMWRRRYSRTPSSALESLLHHIADHYPSGY